MKNVTAAEPANIYSNDSYLIAAGYETFVSKIEVAKDNVDRPEWMGSVDFSGLKLKLIGELQFT